MGSRKVPGQFRLTEMFLRIDRRVKQLLRAINATHQGLWLGLLDRTSLHRVTAAVYESMLSYRQTEYNLSGLTPWETAAVEKFFGDCRSVLVGGAGGGREIIALSRRNFHVAGFEPSAGLLESCLELLAQRGIRAEVVSSAPDEVPGSFGNYDGAIIGWSAYLHIQGRQTRIEFLKQFRNHLRVGGPILLSFWSRYGSALRSHAAPQSRTDRARRLTRPLLRAPFHRARDSS
jgi:hypothetical protein